jgi:hypothetical protein
MSQPRFAEPLLQPFRRCCRMDVASPALRWLQIVQIYFDNVQRILLQEASPQAAMDQAAADIQALVNR